MTFELRLIAIGLAAASVVGAFAVQYGMLKNAQANLSKEKLAHSQTREAGQRVAREAGDKYRQVEALMRAQQKEAADAAAKEREAHDRALADLRNDADRRVRNAIGAYASGRGLTTADTADAARERAETLGKLLDRALLVAKGSVIDAEGLATDVRLLLRDAESTRAGMKQAASKTTAD